MSREQGNRPEAESILAAGMIRPERREKLPPCGANCVSGGDVRGWIGIVAQRQKLGLSEAEAFRQAWEVLAALNPFPATMGRVCPHPCQGECNRSGKDGAVQINALERFLGDWALSQQIALPRMAEPGSRPESIGVIGAGPAGLSFAYQMARRGYGVTVYERKHRPGGMLQFGIPEYRLPEEVLAAEIQRILDLGVDLRLGTAVGRDVTVETLRSLHDVLFVGIGASRGLRLGVPGEEGEGTWTGITYLSRVNQGLPVALGTRVVVVGGGNTAVDAARTARRTGADVTLLYRRTRQEMPAIAAEVDDALTEGVAVAFLTAPVAICREEGVVRAVRVQRMTLGEPDASGRRKPVAVPGSEYEIAADAVIAAVSQEPDWEGLGVVRPDTAWMAAAPGDELGPGMWGGGDAGGLGVAGLAIGQGRQAAESVDCQLRGVPVPAPRGPAAVTSDMVKLDFFAGRHPVTPPERPPEEWLLLPEAELRGTISAEEFLQEAERCVSCGLCSGCEQCFMFCNAEGIVRLEQATPGKYFTMLRDRCLACGKCIDLCPCGFLGPE